MLLPPIPPAAPPKPSAEPRGCANAGGAAPKPPPVEFIVAAPPKPSAPPLVPTLLLFLAAAPNIGAGPFIGVAPKAGVPALPPPVAAVPNPFVLTAPKALLPPVAPLLLLLLAFTPAPKAGPPMPPFAEAAKGDAAVADVAGAAALVDAGKPPPPPTVELNCPPKAVEGAVAGARVPPNGLGVIVPLLLPKAVEVPLPNGAAEAASTRLLLLLVASLVFWLAPKLKVFDEAGAPPVAAAGTDGVLAPPKAVLLPPPKGEALVFAPAALFAFAAEEKEKPLDAGAPTLVLLLVLPLVVTAPVTVLKAGLGLPFTPAVVPLLLLFALAEAKRLLPAGAVPPLLGTPPKGEEIAAPKGVAAGAAVDPAAAVVPAFVTGPPNEKVGLPRDAGGGGGGAAAAAVVVAEVVAGAAAADPAKLKDGADDEAGAAADAVASVEASLPAVKAVVVGALAGAAPNGDAFDVASLVPVITVDGKPPKAMLPDVAFGAAVPLVPPLLLLFLLLLLSPPRVNGLTPLLVLPLSPPSVAEATGAAAANGLAPNAGVFVVVSAGGCGVPFAELGAFASAIFAPNGLKAPLALLTLLVVPLLFAPAPRLTKTPPPLLLLLLVVVVVVPSPLFDGLNGAGGAEVCAARPAAVGVRCCEHNSAMRPFKLATSRRQASMLSRHAFTSSLSFFTFSFSTFSSVSRRLTSAVFCVSASCIFSTVESNLALYCVFTSSNLRVSSSMRASKRLSMYPSRSVKILMSCCWWRSTSCASVKLRLTL